MKTISRTKVSAWQDQGKYTSQTFPGIAVTPAGRIIVTWRGAVCKNEAEDQRVFYAVSDDNGKSWSKPFDVFAPPAIDGRPGVFRMAAPWVHNGRIYMQLCHVDSSVPGRPFFDDETSSLLDCKIFLAESDDDGESWSVPRQLDTAPFAHLANPATGPVQFFSDGEMFSQFELNKPYGSTDIWRHLPVLNFSRDNGRSFYRHAIPAQDPANDIFYWDQRPLILKDDTIVDFFWTWDNAINAYHNITMTASSDRGRSWSLPHDTGISGQAGQPVEFDDGTLLLPLVDRTGKPKIMARISLDRGRSFTAEELEVSEELSRKQTSEQNAVSGAWNEMVNYSLGLPAGIKSNSNTAFIVWYHGDKTDFTDIEFAEVSL